MNKRVFKVAFMVVVIMVGCINVFNAQKSETLSDVALDNVEALAYYVEGEYGDYECEAPYNAVCGIELGQSLPGYRLEL